MTAPVLQAPPVTETATVDRAKAVLAAVGSDAFPWPAGQEGRWIKSYARWLAGDLEARDDLLAGRIHPASEFPELARWWPDDALAQAVEKVVEDIEAGTGVLVERVRRYCGDGTANSVLAAAAEAAQREGEK